MAGIGNRMKPLLKALQSCKEAGHEVRHCAAAARLHADIMWSMVKSPPIPPGYKENAGIFCHNNPWVIIGETVLGRVTMEYFRKICPSYTEEHSALHKVEPYVCCQWAWQGRRPPW